MAFNRSGLKSSRIEIYFYVHLLATNFILAAFTLFIHSNISVIANFYSKRVMNAVETSGITDVWPGNLTNIDDDVGTKTNSNRNLKVIKINANVQLPISYDDQISFSIQ